MDRKNLPAIAWVPSLYFAQGLPYVAVITVSVIMYKRLGMSNSEIGVYTSMLYLPWVLKPLWSPVVDVFFSKRLWTLAMQAGLGVGFAAVAFSLDKPMAVQISLAAFFLLAFLSATHDTASDGFYMYALDGHRQSLMVGVRTAFYRLAMLAGQGGLVYLAGVLEVWYGNIPMAWSMVFVVMSCLFVAFFLLHSFTLPRPVADADMSRRGGHRSLGDILKASADTFISFFRKPGVWPTIAFILLYKFPEAQLVKLINPFLLDGRVDGGMGMTTADVGVTYGVWGLIGIILGGILGGIIAGIFGLRRVLHPLAWCMSLTCLVFVFLSYYTSSPRWVVDVCVFVEQLGYGLGTTAFMLYLLYFSEGSNRTTHYALCTGIMSLGMMLPGMAAGYLQELMGYQHFFLWTMACCAATIGVCYIVKVPASFGRRRKDVAK